MVNKIIFIKNKLKKTKLYWKIRHLFDTNVWEKYQNDLSENRRGFYLKFIKKNKIKSVFEFGCASGPNYLIIKDNIHQYFGYDISSEAINTAKDKIGLSNKILFTTNLNLIISYMNENKIIEFDLAIFDRVLYLINEKEVYNFFNSYANFFKHIIINDFHSDLKINDNEGYLETKNFSKILKNFRLTNIVDSNHKSWNDFTRSYSKILFFENKNKK